MHESKARIPSAIVGCFPVRLELRHDVAWRPYAGSIQLPCRRCGEACWVGPLQQTHAAQGVPVWCLPCAARVFGPDVLKNVVKLSHKKMGE